MFDNYPFPSTHELHESLADKQKTKESTQMFNVLKTLFETQDNDSIKS